MRRGLRRRVGATVCAALVVAAGHLPASAADPAPGRTEVVSVASDGTLANDHSGLPAMSADGRFVAFTNRAENLVPDKSNLCPGLGEPLPCVDVFVHDRESGTTERVSVAGDGTQADGDSSLPSLSADGRHVAFLSEASNLVPDDDTGGVRHAFVHDRESGTNERVSDERASTPAISADGRYVAFGGGTCPVPAYYCVGGILVHDRQSGVTEQVSVASDGSAGNLNSNDPAISRDGRYVAFQSYATNLVPEDTNRAADIFVHDRETGTTERVSVASDGSQGERDASPRDAHQPTISADGRYVAFASYQSNLVDGDTNNRIDVFVHDRETRTTERVSVASDGTEGDAGSDQPHLSADSRYVAFRSSASNLVPGDTNGRQDVFVHDRETRTTERVSVASDGAEGSEHATIPVVSADGRSTAFRSGSPELLAEPSECPSIFGPQPCRHVFVRDRGPASDFTVAREGAGLQVSGRATFSGQVVASGSDPPDDGAPGAEEAGAELTGASLAYRPAQEDLLVRLHLAWLPGERCTPPFLPGTPFPVVCEWGGGAAGVLAPGVLHRRTLYEMAFELDGVPHEVRARSGSRMRTDDGTESDDPHFALYRCDPDCAEQALLTGGIGATGYEAVVSVPLSVLGAAEGAALTRIRASTSREEGAVEAEETLDEVDLPDTAIRAAQVVLGIAPASTPEEQVAYTTEAVLDEEEFSATLDVSSLPAGDYRVWATACLGDACRTRSVGVTL